MGGTGTIIVSSYGKPYSSRGLTHAFYDVLNQLGISGYSIHDLRKNAASALAEAGCTDREIMAITGHRTATMVTRYTRRADQKRPAISAVEKWERRTIGAKPTNARGSTDANPIEISGFASLWPNCLPMSPA